MSRLLAAGAAAALLLCPPAVAGAAEPVPSTRGLYFQLIRQARADGRPRAALAYLDDFDRRYPGDADALVLRINSLLDLGEVARAQAAVRGLPAGTGSPAVAAARGHVLAASGDWAGAGRLYAAALRDSPADPLLRNALGYAQLRLGQARAASDTLRAAADLAPGSEVIRKNLLLALTLSGRAVEVEAGLARIGNAADRARLRAELARQAVCIAARVSAAEGTSPC